MREFDDKWLRGGARAGEALVGSGDIQSLADMSNSFEVVWGMRVVPFTRYTVLQLAVITLLPVVPLLLTMFSPQGSSSGCCAWRSEGLAVKTQKRD